MKKEQIRRSIELGLVIAVCISMFAYGIGKYVQFNNPNLATKTISEMTGMELMWAFYGYSKTYAILLGIVEILGCILFFIQRTRIIGGLLLSGILLNVIIQDLVYSVHVGALIAAITYQLMVFVVLWMNKERLLEGIKVLLSTKMETNIQGSSKIRYILLGVAIAILLKIVEFQLTH